MGYRMYLGKAPKGAELITVEGKHQNRNDEVITQLFELGHYIEWRPQDATELLNNGDTELYIVNKDFLLYLIEEYRKNNYAYFNDLHKRLEPLAKELLETGKTENQDGLSALSETILQFRGKASDRFHCEWGEKSNSLRLEPSNDGQITSSWKYEYLIFNLVHILHTFDWENDDLIYMGH